EDFVVDFPGQVEERIIVALGFAGRLGVGVVGIAVVVGRLVGGFGLGRLLLVGGGFRIVLLGLLGAGIVLSAVLALLLALRLVVFLVLVVFRLVVVAQFLGHLHGGQHFAHDAGEGLLVAKLVGQAVEPGAGLLLDPG